MIPDFKNKEYILSEFIRICMDKIDRPGGYNKDHLYDIYSKFNPIDSLSIVYVGDTVQVDGDDNEIFPDFVVSNGFSLFCTCENVQSVVDLAVKQNPAVSVDQIVKCLTYYLENDDFLDVN